MKKLNVITLICGAAIFGSASTKADSYYVGSAVNNVVELYNSAGQGSVFANSGLSNPEGLAFDSTGFLYAANFNNNTITKYNSSGGGSLFANSGLGGPIGLAFDSAGFLYAGNLNNTIMKFNSSGT